MNRRASLLVVLLTLALLLSSVAAVAASTHIVQPGETLTGIAAQSGAPVDALVQANQLDSADRIYAGQSLVIPDAASGPAASPPVAAAPPSAPPAPPAAAAAPPPADGAYVVQPGDSLSAIAARTGVTQDALQQANGLSDPNLIWAGQRLRIPDSAPDPAPPAPAPPAEAPPATAPPVPAAPFAPPAAVPAPVAAAPPASYTIQPGDNLSSLAAQFGISVDVLAAANGITDPNLLYAGQVLTIPGPPGDPAVVNGLIGTLLRPLDAATKVRLQAVWRAGQARGRRADVLAKVGDSITASGSFLADAGDGNALLGPHPELAPILAFYRATVVDQVGGVAHNSLNRHSLAAHAGWTGADLLGPPGSAGKPAAIPILDEYATVNPAVAVILFGTNDIAGPAFAAFPAHLATVVSLTLAGGIIPVLSTIPDRVDTPAAAARVLATNAAIRALAAREQLPLIDYWAALQALPAHGLGLDGVHPTVLPSHCPACASVTFTPAGLRYGWNLRNYLTLALLAHLRAVVFADGPPDGT